MEASKVLKIENREAQSFGDLPLIQSQTHNTIKFNELNELSSMADKEVTVRVRIHNSRVKGNLAFLVLR